MAAGDKTSPGTAGKGRMRSFLAPVRGATKLLDLSGQVIVFACLASMFGALLVNVVLRYAFGAGIAWAYEIHAILLPWLVAGGLVTATARASNISVTILSDMLGGRQRLVLNLVVYATILVISVSILWSSQPILKASQYQTLSTLGIKQVWGYSSIAFAFGVMALLSLFSIIRTLAGEDVTDPDPAQASLS